MLLKINFIIYSLATGDNEKDQQRHKKERGDSPPPLFSPFPRWVSGTRVHCAETAKCAGRWRGGVGARNCGRPAEDGSAEPLSTCWLQDRAFVEEKLGPLTPLVSHESFVAKDGATNSFFAVHLDVSRAAKSKTNESYMNHLVSWLLFWLPYLLKIFPVPTFFVPFLSTLMKDSFSLLTLKFPEERTCYLLYLSSFKGTQTGDFLKWPTCWSEGFDYHCFKWMIYITLIISFKVIFKIIGVF